MKLNAFICDVDGTVASHEGIRGHHDYGKVKLDEPIWDIINQVKITQSATAWRLLFVTGRPSIDVVRQDTMDWLSEYFDDFGLIMRPAYLDDSRKRDYRSDDIVKEELYLKHIEPHFDTRLVFDDRNRVVSMWRTKFNLTCLQVAEGNF